MYDFNNAQNDIMNFIILLIPCFFLLIHKKGETKKDYITSCVIAIICITVLLGIVISDSKAIENPEIETYTGQYLYNYTKPSPKASQRVTYAVFSSESGEKRGFRIRDVRYFIEPEAGKWYEIHYMLNGGGNVVQIYEVAYPDSLQ